MIDPAGGKQELNQVQAQALRSFTLATACVEETGVARPD